MRAWYHQKDHLIFFKMIPYLLWLCYRGKGSISKYGIRSQLKSCKMNTSGHEESIKNMPFCVELCLLFSAGQLINSMRMRCQVVVQALGSSTRYWALIMTFCHWHQWTLMKSKIPVTISMKIHANQAPATWATSLIWWKSMQIKPLSLHLFMSLLWLMWWMFCEIKWFESSF